MVRSLFCAAVFAAVSWGLVACAQAADSRYQVTWQSLDQRPNPA